MRSKILTAVLATAITMSSCEWLASKKSRETISLIQGRWRLDSITGINDSGNNIFTWLFKTKGTKGGDSANVTWLFNADTLIVKTSRQSADMASFSASGSQIKIKGLKDSLPDILAFQHFGDTAMLLNIDSLSFHFHRLH
jgi:hypothetical protein